MLAFTSILFTALAAFAGAPIWAALIGAAVLFSISLGEQRKFAARFSNIGASHVLTMAHWQSAGHAILASGAAFGLGMVSRWALLA
ncbi:hypothetical protein [Hyphomicrobium sp.]|uniref:hypothetical protein n=1 Tax=Hyphomicrobium sp. TaxID=82 RepID=UPI000F9EC386|nr:hypothetical protein [Hyphomicrobium sp.]RUP10123.1 MAG: hypothetical protein EKK38_06730 [Hyphomicrobium sp.]